MNKNEDLMVLNDRQKNEIIVKPIEDFYNVEATLGKGKFGVVKKIVHKLTGTVYAAKYIRKQRLGKSLIASIHHEIAVLEKCQSEAVVGLNQVFETTREYILVLDFLSGGDLQSVFDNEEILQENDAKKVMRKILEALSVLHDNDIAHLDIKPQNILMSKKGCYDKIKLCDFGISKKLESGDQVRAILGTIDYISPEVLRYDPITLKSDIWSIGVLTYVLLTGFTPFGGENKQETYLNISTGDVSFDDELFWDISKEAIDFIKSTLVLDAARRPTAKELLQNRWFKSLTVKFYEKIDANGKCDQARSLTRCALKDIDCNKRIL